MRVEARRGATAEGRSAAAFAAALGRARRREAAEARAPGRGPDARRREAGPHAPRAAEEARGAPDPHPRAEPAELAPIPELAAVARALPPAIAASRAAGGERLSLSFGRSLEIELRSTAAGVELVLRPEPRLARAAEAELPRVVAALRARGVAVARADVRAAAGGARRAR